MPAPPLPPSAAALAALAAVSGDAIISTDGFLARIYTTNLFFLFLLNVNVKSGLFL